jgi:hypothetical protein
MMEVAAGRPLIEFSKLAYKANLPVMLHGPHGVGKSELVARAARELDIKCISLDLSLLEPADLVGIPQVAGNKTSYAAPDYLPEAGSGLLLIEELNRAPLYMRNPCLMLLTARRLHNYELPGGWLPVAAVNDGNDLYQVDELDPALLSRFMHVRVVPHAAEWLDWARTEGAIHPKVVEFVASCPNVFEDPEANPRALTYVSKALRAWESDGTASTQALAACVSGLIGDRWAVDFLQDWEGANVPLTAHAITDDYGRCRRTVRRWLAAARLDLVEASLLNLKQHIQPQREYEAVVADDQKKANVEQFFRDLPGGLKRQVKEWLDDRGFAELRVARRGKP